MAAPRSADLRERVVAAYLEGDVTYEEVAERFSVGVASVDRWLRLHRETGSVAARPHGGGRKRKVDDEGLELLRQEVETRPDATLAELATMYRERKSVRLALCMVHRALVRLGITRKKRSSTHPSASKSALV